MNTSPSPARPARRVGPSPRRVLAVGLLGAITALSAGVAIAVQTGAIRLGHKPATVASAPSDTVLDLGAEPVAEEVSVADAADPLSSAPDTVVRYEDVYVVDAVPSATTATAAVRGAASPARTGSAIGRPAAVAGRSHTPRPSTVNNHERSGHEQEGTEQETVEQEGGGSDD